MCLSKIYFTLNKVKNEFVGTGYKLLRSKDGLRGSDYLGNFRKDRWLKAEGLDNEEYGYPLGFHLFLTPEDAKKYDNYHPDYVVAEFKYRKVVTLGDNLINGGFAMCVVAEEMKFVKLLTTV